MAQKIQLAEDYFVDFPENKCIDLKGDYIEQNEKKNKKNCFITKVITFHLI